MNYLQTFSLRIIKIYKSEFSRVVKTEPDVNFDSSNLSQINKNPLGDNRSEIQFYRNKLGIQFMQ